MEGLLVLGLVMLVGWLVYRAGKRTGSRKGYAVGRWQGRRH